VAADTNNTNRLNTVSSPVNDVSSSFTIVDPRRERARKNEFESIFGQEKYTNSNMMFTPVSAAGSTYVNLGGSILVNAATLPNANLPTDPLMPDLEDTADLQDTEIFSGAYDDEVEGAIADFKNLELTIVFNPIPTTRIYKDHPKEQIIWDPLLAPQTRRMTKTSQEHAVKKQKSRRKQRKEIEVPSPSSEIPNEEGVPTTSNDQLPSGEDRMQLNELMILCTNLQKQVLDLEEAKTAQAKEIAGLKKRVNKLEQKGSQELQG
nr:hypothetical protein [Tanacetum cinerariifolium]GEZ71032.1 hypothetical protein [Tanacetum cinerariifolium]